MNDLKFTFSLDETNLILESLGEQPYVKVSQLIAKIQQQAGAQLQVTQNDNAKTHGTTTNLEGA